VALLAVAGGGAAAGESGRWSWDALVGVDSFTRESETTGSSTSEYDQRAIRLRAGANGYILHPLIGRFRLDGDAYLLNRSGGGGLDSDRFGLGATVKLLPKGSFTTDLFFRRDVYDYSVSGADDPLTRVGAPELRHRWGATTQLRRGALRGASLGFDRSEIEFDDPGADTERLGREFFRWSRSTGGIRHDIQLERTDREYGTTDLSAEDYRLILNESGSIAPSWRWQLRGSGFQRESELPAGVEQSAERYSMNNRFTRSFGGTRELDLVHQTSRISTDPGFRSVGHGLSARHRSPIGAGWHVAPFVSFSYVETGPLETRIPEAGTALNWLHTRGRLRATASFDTRIAWLETEDGTMEERQRQLGYSAFGTIGGGDPLRLRTEFSLGFSGSEVRIDQEPIVELPDLGFLNGALGTQDVYSARLDLTHREDGSSLSGWTRWVRRESAPIQAQGDAESETLTSTVQYGVRRFTIQGSAGRTTAERDGQPGQEVLHRVVSARWRPWWPLSTRLTYAVDRRTVTLGPDVDGSRLELLTDLQLGNLRLETRFYENEDEVQNGGSRVNRGFRWSISTRFAGWLPVYSGTRRKGVIR
jgi:hypothetical protein